MSLPVVIEITFEDNDVEEEVESEYFNEYRYLSDENGQYSGYIDEDWDIEPQPLVLEFKCQHCGKLYENDDKLRRHLRNHQERKHACEHCGRKFLYRKDKITHERTHTGERPFTCQVCGKSFIQKCTLNNHLVCHYKQHKDIFCEICGRGYYHQKSLALHMNEKHPTSLKIRTCQFCNKEFNAYTKWIYHVKNCKEVSQINRKHKPSESSIDKETEKKIRPKKLKASSKLD